MGQWNAPTATRHVEAKTTSGGNDLESVTWSEAFSSNPVVSTGVRTSSAYGYMVSTESVSTTGASVRSYSDSGVGVSKKKDCIAQEET